MNDKNSILEYPRINYYAILSLTLFYLFIIFIYQSFKTHKRNRRSPFCLIRIHNLVMWIQTKKNIPFQEETTNRQITSWKYFWSEIFLVCSDEIRLSHICHIFTSMKNQSEYFSFRFLLWIYQNIIEFLFRKTIFQT